LLSLIQVRKQRVEFMLKFFCCAHAGSIAQRALCVMFIFLRALTLAFASLLCLHEPPKKCDGQTPCPACTTCSRCRHCKVVGGTCGACQHSDNTVVMASGTCFALAVPLGTSGSRPRRIQPSGYLQPSPGAVR